MTMRKYIELRGVFTVICALWIAGPASAQVAGGSGPMVPVPGLSTPLGSLVSNFGGLQFAVAQGSLGNPSGTMTGYAAGDIITLQCPGVSFSTAPRVSVVAQSGGAVTTGSVIVTGVTSNAVPSGSATCTQASTTGAGTGYQVNVNFGLIAAYIAPPSLTTGGGIANQNFFLNSNPNDQLGPFSNAGAEDTFFGDEAGFGLITTSSYNTAFGNSACGGIVGTGAPASNGVVCEGTDAGRNIQGNVSGSTMIGAFAGKNNAGQNNTFLGVYSGGNNGNNNAGLITGTQNTGVGGGTLGTLSSGSFNTVGGYNSAAVITQGAENTGFGYQILSSCTTCAGNTVLGLKAGDSLVAGQNNIIIQAQTGSDACSNGDESNVIALCAGAGRVWTTTGAGTPGTAVNKISGSIINIGTAPTLTTGTCSGSAWVGGAVVGKFTAPTCAAGTIILSGLPVAPNGYVCNAQDQTTPADTLKQTANSTTSCTLTSTTVASDVIVVSALGF